MEQFKLDFINRVRQHWLLRNFVFSPDVLDFIACQFALESDFGTSSLALTRNNFCGMKVPYKRLTYRICSIKPSDGFCAYSSFDNCILDYVSWLFYNRPYQNALQSVDAFKIFLRNSGYCPEKGYIDLIDSIYKQLKTYQND